MDNRRIPTMKFHTVDVQGKFWTQRVADKDTTHHKSITDKGRIIYSRADSKLYFGGASDWQVVMGKYDFITSDTRMMFGYFPLPDGWNINVTKDDMSVSVTLADDVGTIEGSWTISGMEDAGVHDHGGFTGPPDATILVGKSDVENPRAGSNAHLHSIFADGAHMHGFNIDWRPAYVKFLEAKFD
jgi:hypothetical protein